MIADGAALGRQVFGEDVDPRELLLRMYPGAAAVIPPLSQVVGTARPLVARINHGIWIASCDCGAPANKIPTPGCVVFLDRLLGWCIRCQNGATGRGWRPVAVPPPELRAAIEAVLLCRPNVEDRNWEPDETLDDLIAQNREHGDPVPEVLTTVAPVPGPDWRETVTPFGPLPQLARGLGRRLLGRVRRR